MEVLKIILVILIAMWLVTSALEIAHTAQNTISQQILQYKDQI